MPETSTPFDSIESAHEYIGLLCEALDDADRTIGQEIAHPCESRAPGTSTRCGSRTTS